MTRPGKPTAVSLDVRPMLAAGEEPLQTILSAAATIEQGGTLQITAPFEPVPLYRVLSVRGFGHATERRGAEEVVVRFTQLGIRPESTVAEVYERYPSTAPVFATYGLDLCCGGDKTLEFAAGAHGVDLGKLLAQLQGAALSP